MNFLVDAILAWKTSRSKIRGREWSLAPLTDEQLANVLEMILKGMRHQDIADYCKQDYGIDKLAETTLSNFWREVSPFILPARSQAAVRGSEEVVKGIAAKDQEQIDKANLFLLKRTAFEQLNSPVPDAKLLAVFANAILKIRDQTSAEQDMAIKLRRLEILEKQTNEATRTAGDSKLSDAEKAARIREIFQKK